MSFRCTLCLLLVLLVGACRERAAAREVQPASGPSKQARTRLKAQVREIDSASPWHSASSCEKALGKARAERRVGVARLGSWNVRWFPDGVPGKRAPVRQHTNLEWLACAIAWLDVDVLAVQEFKRHTRADSRLTALLGRLDHLTLGAWRSRFDDCPAMATQHVGFLYDSKRVRVDEWRTYASLNPHGDACKDQLRPGLGGYFRFAGGLDAHIITVHLKSGTRRRALTLRQQSIQGITTAYREAQHIERDADVIVLGDFNTMGCPHCSPKLSAEQELSELAVGLERLPTPFRLMDAREPGCSHYFRGKPSLLDHVSVARGLREIEPTMKLRASGYCEETACLPAQDVALPVAYEELSDHCPIVIDLIDKDLD